MKKKLPQSLQTEEEIINITIVTPTQINGNVSSVITKEINTEQSNSPKSFSNISDVSVAQAPLLDTLLQEPVFIGFLGFFNN